jgi:hypothetical protein
LSNKITLDMPAKSQQQLKFIFAMRRKYGSKKSAPKNMKWLFDKEWTDVRYKDLPKKKVRNYSEFLKEFYLGDY